MANTLNEYKWLALANAGYGPGTLGGMEYEWLTAETGATPPVTLNELWHLHLDGKGIAPGHLGERLWDWLEQQGYEGTLNEKLWQAWKAAAEGGGVGKYIATSVSYSGGGTAVVVFTNDLVGASTGAGFTMTVDGNPVGLTYDGFQSFQLNFTAASTLPIGANVVVTYTPGDTTSQAALPLEPFSGKADEGTGEYAFAAAGSLTYLSDGAVADNYIFQAQAKGFGTPTFTTPSGLMLPDHEGVYYQLKAGEMPVYGARRVENRLNVSDDINAAGWSSSGTQVGDVVTLPAVATAVRSPTTAFDGKVVNLLGSVYIPPASEWSDPDASLRWTVAGVGLYARDFTPNTVNGGNGGWVCAKVRISSSAAGNNDMRLANNSGAEVTCNQRLLFQLEDAKGITADAEEVAMSEYIATSGTQRALYFTNVKGNTIDANGVVTEAVGSVLSEQPSLYAAPELTNTLTLSNDLGAWTGTAVGTLDAAGLTGEPNTATTLVDAGANHKNRGQGVPAAGQPATLRIFLEKDAAAGTGRSVLWWNQGTERMWLDIDTSTGVGAEVANDTGAWEIVDGGRWWIMYLQFTPANTTTINCRVYPSRTGTANTPVVVGNVEHFLNKTIAQVKGSAPIVTAGAAVTRGQVYGDFDIGNSSNTEGCWFIEVRTPELISNWPGPNPTIIGLGTNAEGQLIRRQTPNLRARGNALANVAWTLTTDFTKLANAYSSAGGGNIAANAEGVWSADTAGFTAWSGQPIRLGITGTPTTAPLLIRNLRRYDLPYAEAKAKIDELML